MVDETERYIDTPPLSDLSKVHSCNPHDVTLVEAITLAKKLGEKRIPQEIVIIGISMAEIPCEFGERLSKIIAAAVPHAVEMTFAEISNKKKFSKKRKQDNMNI